MCSHSIRPVEAEIDLLTELVFDNCGDETVETDRDFQMKF